MILERLELERVRRFTPGFTCTFAPGLNAVLGPNESGKSTIYQALLAALFIPPQSTKAEVRSLYSWFDERPFALRLVFRQGDSRYSLRKDFHAKDVFLEEQPSGRVWKDPRSVHDRLKKLSGLESLELFAASAAVAQGGLSLSEKGKGRKALDEALAEVLTGKTDGQGAARAMELLSKDIQRLTVGLKEKAYKTPGPIKAAEERLVNLHRRHHDTAASFAQRVSYQRALKSAEEELGELDRALELKEAVLSVEAERSEIEAALEEQKKLFQEVNRRHQALEDNRKQTEEMSRALKDLGPVANLEEEDVLALKAALARRDSLAGPLKETRDKAESAAAPKPWGALILGVLGLAVPLVAGFASPWLWLKASSAVLGLAALAAAGWLWSRRKAALRVLAERRAEARRAEAELGEVEARLHELLEKAGGGKAEEVLVRAKEADRLQGELNALQSERRGLLGGMAAESLEAEWSESLRRMAVAEKRLGEERFSGPALDAEGFGELKREVDSLRSRREELSGKVERLAGILEVSDDEAEELARLEEEIEGAERELRRWRERLRVREAARSALEEARDSALAPAAERFQDVLGRYIGVMSRGRYSAIRLGGSLAELEVQGPEREDFVEPKELSFGTAEQLLLAARLTLTELLSGSNRPPLLLDEPFGSFDEGRLRATMELLSSISKERQIILLTHQESVASACDHVVTLPPPGGGS